MKNVELRQLSQPCSTIFFLVKEYLINWEQNTNAWTFSFLSRTELNWHGRGWCNHAVNHEKRRDFGFLKSNILFIRKVEAVRIEERGGWLAIVVLKKERWIKQKEEDWNEESEQKMKRASKEWRLACLQLARDLPKSGELNFCWMNKSSPWSM